MTSSRTSFPLRQPRRVNAAACGFFLLFTIAATAQNAPPAPVPPPAPAHQPGMLDSVGRWFKDSFSFLSSNVEGAKNTMSGIGERAGGAANDAANAAKDAANVATNAASNAATAAKDAAAGAARLPGTRVVTGRSRCDLAPNGGPDCGHAAEALCRSKGYKSGSSLDITAAKDCPTEAYIRRESKDCKVASFVVRAVCQ